MGFMLLSFTLAELALQRGISRSFPEGSPVSNLSKQPWRLRRAIIRYVYFCEYLQKQGKLPTVQDIDDSLEFIEANRNGRPPSWTSFLRHPLTVMTFVSGKPAALYPSSVRVGTISSMFNTMEIGHGWDGSKTIG